MTLRRTLLGASAGALLLAVGSSVRADVPVIDTAALSQWYQQIANDIKTYALQVQQWSTQNLSWLMQVQQYATQTQQYLTETEQLLAFVHNPNLGSAMALLNAIGLNSVLPINPYTVMGLIDGMSSFNGIYSLNGILGSLSSISGSFWTTNHVYTPTDGSWASQQIIDRANGIAGVQGAAGGATNDLATHATALQALRTRLETATNPKDVADIEAQIQLEMVWTQNEQARLSAIQAMYAAQTDALTQRDNERLAMDIENFVSSSPTPTP